MRLSTRIGLSAALAALPLLGISIYGAERMQDLAAVNQRLTERQVTGLQIGSGVISRLERLGEYVGKYAASRDEGYAQKFEETIQAISKELTELSVRELSPEEQSTLSQLQTSFRPIAQTDLAPLAESHLDDLSQALPELIHQALELQRQTRLVADAEAANAIRMREQTWRTTWLVGSCAVGLSIFFILLSVRSLRRRLDALIRGTRAVSQGKFTFQLDASPRDELGQMAQAFNLMVRELEQLERLKSDFISSVSHELRTPIVVMIESNQFLLDELPGPLNEKQKHMLKLNTQAAQRLSQMITDLLELSRLKSGIRYSLSDQDLAALTNTAVSEFEAVAHDRSLSLQALTPASLPSLCDPDRYVQLVQNLVENALKYTPSGGRIEVHLGLYSSQKLPLEAHVGDQPQNYAWLRIEDSGPGIPEPDRVRVFEKFFRREGLPSDGSVGLGLAICREIVEAHGGTMWIGDSESLHGAQMNVVLPLRPPTPTQKGNE